MLAKALYDQVRVMRNDYYSVLQVRELGFRLSVQANNVTYVAQQLSGLKATLANGLAQMQARKMHNPVRKANALGLIQGALSEL